MNEIAGLEGDALTDEIRSEADKLTAEYRDVETRHRAATRTVTAPAASVVHLRYATEAHRPARGMSPLQYASYTGTLAGHLEQKPGYEAGGAVARLIALPEGHNNPAGLTDAIKGAKGRTLLPETTAGG